jgi:hypothetical protein
MSKPTIIDALDPVEAASARALMTAWCITEAARYSLACLECPSCGALVSTRYAFRACTACAMRENAENPAVMEWRADQRNAARERIAEMKRRKAEAGE